MASANFEHENIRRMRTVTSPMQSSAVQLIATSTKIQKQNNNNN